jgi:hypothetical protein
MLVFFLCRRFSGGVIKSKINDYLLSSAIFSLCEGLAADFRHIILRATLTPISPERVRRRELCPPMRTDVPANDVTDLFPAHQ